MALVRFGDFEADLQTGEIFTQGRKIPLEAKPFEILATLLERPGQLVTREDLRRRIWPPGTYVDFSRCVNIAVTKLRRALLDSSDNPSYIETLPKRGYRLIASVEERKPQRQVGTANPAEAAKHKIRVAILPFEAICESPEQANFSEKLIDEVISQFGSCYAEHVGLIARTSNLKYPAAAKSITQIGRDLKVDHVLTGNARFFADRVQVTAQLTPTSGHSVSWSEDYDCAVGDVFKARNEVATKISRFVGRKVLSIAVEQARPNKEAYLEYLKGRQCHSGRTAAAFWRSIRHFEQAIYLDPSYAPAYSELANARVALGGAVFGSGHPRDFYQQAKEAALKALEINDRISDSHTSWAIVKFFYEWDWASAERSLDRAIELEPSNSLAHQIYSRLLSSLRRHEHAVEKARRLCELEPLSPQAHFLLGEVWYFAREYDKALEAFQSALDLDEMHGPAMLGAANVYSQMAMHDEAVSRMERAYTLYPENPGLLASLGAIYARAGRLGGARIVLNKLKAASKQRYVSPFDFGVVATGLGQREKALDFFQLAYQESSPMLIPLLSEDPRFDSLQNNSGYSELVGRVRDNNRAMLPASPPFVHAPDR